MEKQLFSVNRKIFADYIKRNSLKEVQGPYFHSSNYIDEDGNVLAYHESSSWSTMETFMIADYPNMETEMLVTHMFNGESWKDEF